MKVVPVQLKHRCPKPIEVIGGVNFPLVLEAALQRMTDLDLGLLAGQIVESGRAFMILNQEDTLLSEEDE